jgi:hypothetical protein
VRITPAFCLSLLLFSLSCKSTGGFQDFKVRVDSTQLGSLTSFGQITLRQPKGWIGADSITQAATSRIITEDGAAVPGRAAILYKPETKSLMIGHVAAATANFDDWTAESRQNFQRLHGGASFSESRLRINGVPLIQLFAADSMGVHFRLLLNSQPPTVLDYIISQSALGSDLRAVESSMGTIHKG